MSQNAITFLNNVLAIIDDDTQYDDVAAQIQAVERIVKTLNKDVRKVYKKLYDEIYIAKGAMCDVIPEIRVLIDALEK